MSKAERLAPAMIEVQVSQLAGAALDWAMAVIDGIEFDIVLGGSYGQPNSRYAVVRALTRHTFSPTTDKHQLWQMIEKHGANIGLELRVRECSASYQQQGLRIGYTARTLPVAAIRAIVAALLGDIIRVPQALIYGPENQFAHLAGVKPTMRGITCD